LTTVRQPFDALGETAAHLLLDRMTGRYKGAPRRVLLPTHLVVRDSCGSEAQDAPDTGAHEFLTAEVTAR
jgi:LacI family transcriptional regulator